MPAPKRIVVIGLLGTTLDSARPGERWDRWRPTVGICMHEDVEVHRFELLYDTKFQKLADVVMTDMRHVSPETEVVPRLVHFRDAWDFTDVYAALHDFARTYPFNLEEEDYLVHITTGTHVAQICLFLLTEARYLPGRLLQTMSPRQRKPGAMAGGMSVIDLDLSRYDRLASRFEQEQLERFSLLKSGIATRNAAFNRTIEQVEKVAVASTAPILLLGPTGAGKSQLARRIFEMKKARNQVSGRFVEVNCGTFRGDAAVSALFGHRKGAYTGATSDREGLMRAAHKGMLFLDEIGELSLDMQVLLLRALEEKSFLPMGADEEVRSDFQLLAGTNRDLRGEAAAGRFRPDLLARINLWTFELPGLADRREDIEPNLDHELEAASRQLGRSVRFNAEARRAYLDFALSPEARWGGNFRDLNASVTRLATLAGGRRIDLELVRGELDRLRADWRAARGAPDEVEGSARRGEGGGTGPVSPRSARRRDPRVPPRADTLADAGRRLFAQSRLRKSSANDSDRLKKYLARFELDWAGGRRGRAFWQNNMNAPAHIACGASPWRHDHARGEGKASPAGGTASVALR
ncbi:MAG: RNA repair transcriptional activator RtcR [Kiritimatiellia bacterium]